MQEAENDALLRESNTGNGHSGASVLTHLHRAPLFVAWDRQTRRTLIGAGMQGFIHLMLEAYVSETLGAQHLREIRRRAGIDGPALATEHYPDTLTIQFIQAVADYQGAHPDDVLYRFGVYFINAPLLDRNYGAYLDGHASARGFLESTPGIHNMLGSHFKATAFPKLELLRHASELVEVVYSSPRQLCRFLLGIIEGVGQRFSEPLEVREMECQRRGAPACRILIRFLAARQSSPMPPNPSQANRAASGPQSQSGPQKHTPAQDARRQHEQEADVLILQVLAASQPPQGHLPGISIPREPPLGLMLSLFEIARRLTVGGAPAEYTRLSLLQRALTRLTLQGFIESKLDPHALHANHAPDVMALGGPGILAAHHYRITPTGQTWLREMQHRQGH